MLIYIYIYILSQKHSNKILDATRVDGQPKVFMRDDFRLMWKTQQLHVRETQIKTMDVYIITRMQKTRSYMQERDSC